MAHTFCIWQHLDQIHYLQGKLLRPQFELFLIHHPVLSCSKTPEPKI
jgi:hypothetical protein